MYKSNSVILRVLFTLFCLLGRSFTIETMAQETLDAHAVFTYEISDNTNITLREAKLKCIELAKAKAIKEKFGEMITSDVIDTNVETNGESTSSFFWENTVAQARGNWLGDTQKPHVNIKYKDGNLIFTAEVWGTVREIVQANVELKWSILKEGEDKKIPAESFVSGEKLYVSFRSPADGYVAVYLITGDDQTACLLPYKKNVSGRFPVKGGTDYVFFDKTLNSIAQQYALSTKDSQEQNQLVIIFSPNSFTKCNDITGDKYHPNSLSTHDFQKWLLRCQRADKDMVVNKKWVAIHNPNAKKE